MKAIKAPLPPTVHWNHTELPLFAPASGLWLTSCGRSLHFATAQIWYSSPTGINKSIAYLICCRLLCCLKSTWDDKGHRIWLVGTETQIYTLDLWETPNARNSSGHASPGQVSCRKNARLKFLPNLVMFFLFGGFCFFGGPKKQKTNTQKNYSFLFTTSTDEKGAFFAPLASS